MAAPSSAQTRPSANATTDPSIQPSIARGPPITLSIAGIVIKGPTPHIEFILMAVAEISPIDWWKCGFSTTGVSVCVTSGLYLWLFTQLTHCLTAREVD